MRIVRLILVAILLGTISAGIRPAVVNGSPSMPFEGPGAAHSSPELGARSSIAVDLTNGLQLHADDADTQVAPASTMKVVTALVARQILDPAETVTIIEDDLYLGEEYSQMGLMAGDVATVESLFYGALLMSGADASLALARVAGQRLDPSTSDPVGRFVQQMNTYAQQYKMFGSQFTNPVGIDDEAHYTTARDLVRASEQMLNDWLLARVIATPEIVVAVGGPNAREIYLYSTNQFVLNGEAIGGKTGTTEAAGQCLINIVKRGEHILVTVVMGSQDRFADTQVLLDSLFERFRFVDLGAGSSVPGIGEELAALNLAFPVASTVIMTPEQEEQLSYDLQLTGNRSSNGRAGVVVFSIGEREVLRLPVHNAS